MHRQLRILAGVLFILALVATGSVYGDPSGDVLYVKHDATGGDDGSSWADAYRDLQDALFGAATGDEIWVAQGIYYPAAHAEDRKATFELRDGVALYGGFDGTETERDQRDWEANVTVLSGDLDRNDTPEGTVGDNAYHVVTVNGAGDTTVLDGFTVMAGLADGSEEVTQRGAGMYLHAANLTVANVTFSGNHASYGGGGMRNYGSSPTLTNVSFSANQAKLGGGMYNYESSPRLSKVTFSGNQAEYQGGGLYNWDSSPTLSDAIFVDNQAESGGGMYNDVHSDAMLTNVSFLGNRASKGGGAMGNHRSDPTLTHVIFADNEAGNGGGMYNEVHSDANLTNVAFIGNQAQQSGGGMLNEGASKPALTNVTFGGNQAGSGGGMYNAGRGDPNLTNVTFGGNNALSTGGALSNEDSSPLLTNCILWGNLAPTGAQIYNVGSSAPSVTYSEIQGGYSGEGNIDADPLFVDPVSADEAPTTAGNYRLTAGSPAMDAGTNDAVAVETDLDGNPRIVDGTEDGSAVVDMGAYEFQNSFSPLTIIREGEGTVTSTPDGVDCGSVCAAGFAAGTEVTLTATAETGWTFEGWSGDISSKENPLVLTLGASKTLTATFELTTHVITPTSGIGGAIAPSTPQTVNYGDDITFTIAAEGGYRIADVVVDGVSQGAVNSYTFSDVSANHTISATFVLSGAPAVTSPDRVTFVVGAEEAFTVTTTGFPTPTIALSGALPGGVTFEDHGDGSATLSGSPVVGSTGDYALSFTASNGVAPDAIQAFALTVQAKVYLPLVVANP